MPKCPECNASVGKADAACNACGIELGAPPPPPPPAQQSDGAKYAMIIGGIIVAAIVLLFLSSGMGGSKCKECKAKGYTICVVCKDGRPKCQLCKGSGADPSTQSTCASCGGRGTAQVCYNCKGTPKKTCPSCGGSGSVK
jgi:hypothetical protein